jgi:hypothetical protein
VGLVPLFAIANLPLFIMKKFEGFESRTKWFLTNRSDLATRISFLEKSEKVKLYLLAIPNAKKVVRVFKYLFDEKEFLSPFGIRSLSKYHKGNRSNL